MDLCITRITPASILDKRMTYDKYISDKRVKRQREEPDEAVV